MRIDLQIDSAPLVLRLQNGQRRLAYAVVNAINNTAKRIQAVERRRVEEEFTVRKKDFISRQAAVIKPFANVQQGRPYAEIGVGQKPRLLLSTPYINRTWAHLRRKRDEIPPILTQLTVNKSIRQL